MAALSREAYSKLLGVSGTATPAQLKQAYLKQCLKWHPNKCHTAAAKKKFEEISHAYEALSDPTVKIVDHGQVVRVPVAGSPAKTQLPPQTFSAMKRLGPAKWTRQYILAKGMNSAFELFSEYMYDGDLGEHFTDADDNLHVIVPVPLIRALIGGTLTYSAPHPDGTPKIYTDDISGILDGYWQPMRKIETGERDVWVIYKVAFPQDITEAEQLELRQKLLMAQTSAAIFPPLFNWFRTHPKASVTGILSSILALSVLVNKSMGV